MSREEFEGLDRESLVVRAEASGIRRARILTRPELIDELLRRDGRLDASDLRRSRGFFGRARDLLSRVVERGLHLPDAVDRIRWSGVLPPSVPQGEPEILPTLTLAEIYAAQGHKSRAIDTLRRVLEREPEHGPALLLLARLQDTAYVAPPPPLPPELEVDAPVVVDEVDEVDESDEVAEALDTRVNEALGTEADVVRQWSECVALPVEAGKVFVWWRLGTDLEDQRTAGPLVVRAAVVVPSWDGPVTELRDVEVPRVGGDLLLLDLPSVCVVRVAIGTLHDGAFVPVAHSLAFELGPETTGDRRELVRWALDGLRCVDDEELPLCVSLAREAARAHVEAGVRAAAARAVT